jgi:hypothetical protein
VRLLHCFSSKPTDDMVGCLQGEERDLVEERDLAGDRARLRSQFFVMEYLPMTVEQAMTDLCVGWQAWTVGCGSDPGGGVARRSV